MRISVITVNFNNKNGLIKTIESVLEQTYKNIEYIIIDGNSTDGSKDVIENIKEHLSYCVSEKDNGIYDAMNKGIKQATGDYCLFLNSGDFFVNKNVLSQIFFNKTYSNDLLIGRQKFINEKGKISESPYIRVQELDMAYFITSTLPHQATFIKRNTLVEYGMYNTNYRIVADWIFWIEAIVKHKCSIKLLPEHISYMEKGGISNDMSNCYNEMEKYLTICQQEGYLKWEDIFTISKQARNYVIAKRNKISDYILKAIIWVNKYKK